MDESHEFPGSACDLGQCMDAPAPPAPADPLPLERAVRVQLGEVKHVHLKLNRTGHGCKLLFDGVEQQNVWSVAVKAEVQDVTSVIVGFYPTEVTVEGEAGDVVKVDCARDLEVLFQQAYARGFKAGARR